MLLKYGAKNFFCFKEYVEISFELNANCPESISGGEPYTNIMCVKGANGSGKTNALKILSTIGLIASRSFKFEPEETLPFEPFFDSKEPTEFYVSFIVNNIEYRYELIATKNSILSEKLFRKSKRMSLVIERENNEFKNLTKGFKDLEIMRLRSNASLISTARQYDIGSLSDVSSFFELITSNISLYGLTKTDPNLSHVSSLYHKGSLIFDFAKNIIRKCDLGIDDIEIRKIRDEDGETVYYPVFFHNNNKLLKTLTFQNQSNGTKSLFFNLIRYKSALMAGKVLVMDEIDINLHPHILPVLLEQFTNKEINAQKGQLIFTTNNSEIMDYMGRYRTILVNKEDNESYAYRLDEIPGDILRNDRPIAPVYNAGKIGGVPRV